MEQKQKNKQKRIWILEQSPSALLLTEDKNSDEALDKLLNSRGIERQEGEYYFGGPCADFSEKNDNERLYDKDDYLLHLPYLNEQIKMNALLGSPDHDEDYNVSMRAVSHMVKDLWLNEEDSRVWIIIKLTNNYWGKEMQALADDKIPMFISSRATGFLNEETGEVTLDTIYTYDIVYRPGFSCAHLEALQESLQFGNGVKLYEYKDLTPTKVFETLKFKIESGESSDMNSILSGLDIKGQYLDESGEWELKDIDDDQLRDLEKKLSDSKVAIKIQESFKVKKASINTKNSTEMKDFVTKEEFNKKFNEIVNLLNSDSPMFENLLVKKKVSSKLNESKVENAKSYEVIVEGEGSVYSGSDAKEAKATYEKHNGGDKIVSFLADKETITSYDPTNTNENSSLEVVSKESAVTAFNDGDTVFLINKAEEQVEAEEISQVEAWEGKFATEVNEKLAKQLVEVVEGQRKIILRVMSENMSLQGKVNEMITSHNEMQEYVSLSIRHIRRLEQGYEITRDIVNENADVSSKMKEKMNGLASSTNPTDGKLLERLDVAEKNIVAIHKHSELFTQHVNRLEEHADLTGEVVNKLSENQSVSLKESKDLKKKKPETKEEKKKSTDNIIAESKKKKDDQAIRLSENKFPVISGAKTPTKLKFSELNDYSQSAIINLMESEGLNGDTGLSQAIKEIEENDGLAVLFRNLPDDKKEIWEKLSKAHKSLITSAWYSKNLKDDESCIFFWESIDFDQYSSDGEGEEFEPTSDAAILGYNPDEVNI